MTDEGRMADARDRLAALRNGFAERLAIRLRELEEAVEATRARHDGALKRTAELAHKLSGTAGSYGYHEVGEGAAELEALCRGGFDGERARAIVERLWKGAQRP